MATFTINAWQVDSRNADGSRTAVVLGSTSPVPARRVEADSIPEIASSFRDYVAACEATGKPLECFVVHRAGRKPRGFDKAADRGGALNAYVNFMAAPVTL